MQCPFPKKEMNVITKQISPLLCRTWKVILWHTSILNTYLQGESSWISTQMRCVPAKAAQFPKKARVHAQKHTQGWYWYLTTFLSFFFFFTYLFNFSYAGYFCYEGFFSSCSEPGPLSGCTVQASPCNRFSYCKAQALWCMDSVVVSPGH